MSRHLLLTGAVLAGGKSSRLGQDKCALTLGKGKADMLTGTIRLLRELLDEVVVVGRSHSEAVSLPDDVPGAGPAGAITTALRQTGRSCLVLPCDLPFMRKQTLSLLIRAWEKREPGTLVTAFRHGDTGKKENLVAVYEPGALTFLEPYVQKKLLKLARIVPEDRSTFIPVPPGMNDDFFNINHPEDLREAERRLASI